jgi:hypothetical protein
MIIVSNTMTTKLQGILLEKEILRQVAKANNEIHGKLTLCFGLRR